MSDLTLRDFRPPVRFAPDNAIWNRWRIEHAVLDTGPWSTIEGPAALSPAVVDPSNPPVYSFTSSNAPEDGWFRVVWVDVNDVEQPTRPIQRHTLPSWAPTVQDVADHILQRTVEPGGRYVGTFTDKTRPDSNTVNRMIWKAVQRVESLLTEDPTGNIRDEATDLAAIRTALMIELTLYSEQIDTDRSPYRHLKELWESAVGPIVGGGRGGGTGGDIQGEIRTGAHRGLFVGPEPDFPEIL